MPNEGAEFAWTAAGGPPKEDENPELAAPDDAVAGVAAGPNKKPPVEGVAEAP